jgi:hypothetical protein
LAKLTGKKLVHRIERSRRYAVDPSGVRTLSAYLLLREKVIKPLLAGVTRPYRRSPKIIAPWINIISSSAKSFTKPLKQLALRPPEPQTSCPQPHKIGLPADNMLSFTLRLEA